MSKIIEQAQAITIKLAHLRLQALRWGDATKPPLLAIHGWLDNAASFSELAPLLSDYHVIAVDMPGHGHSDHLPAGQRYHFLDAVEIVIEILDQLGWQQAILLGHSLGGAIASVVAASFAERVSHLIMIDSIGPLSEESVNAPGRLREAVNAFLVAEKMERKTYSDFASMLNLRGKINHVPEKLIQPLVERAIKKTDEGFRWRFDPSLSLPSLSYFTEDQVLAFLAAIKVPTLLLEASSGILTDNQLLKTRKLTIDGLQIETLPGPHHLHLTAAQELANLIREFLNA
jgi:pimeloyl-ACP methyl ester carboxylesterase